jgi:DNA-binding CsgD family transcriptional regulator
MCCYDGPEEAGRKALAPLLGALPAPWFNWMGMMPYPAVQSMFDGLYPKGMQWYWWGDFVKTLPDAAIDTHLEQAAKTPSELSLMPPEAVVRQFNLTPAEVRVLFAIIEIGGVPEVAPVLGISEQTVKTHLHRIYEKTATRRQADLVKLVAGYSGRP